MCAVSVDMLYYDFLWNVHSRQQCARYEWIYSPCEDGLLLNSVLPVYDAYDSVWINSGFENPFEFDWLGFQCTASYFELILGVLIEQLVIWGVDEDTKGSWMYGWIDDFFEAVRALYGYCLDKGII